MQIGNLLQIDFDIESREYNNKWYTDIKAWKIEVAGTSTQKIHDNEVNTVDFIQNSEKKRRIAILKKNYYALWLHRFRGTLRQQIKRYDKRNFNFFNLWYQSKIS